MTDKPQPRDDEGRWLSPQQEAELRADFERALAANRRPTFAGHGGDEERARVEGRPPAEFTTALDNLRHRQAADLRRAGLEPTAPSRPPGSPAPDPDFGGGHRGERPEPRESMNELLKSAGWRRRDR